MLNNMERYATTHCTRRPIIPQRCSPYRRHAAEERLNEQIIQ